MKKIPTTKPKWGKNSYDKKQNIDMGTLMFVQIPNSTTFSKKKIDFSIIAWWIKHDQKLRKSKKIDFWGSDLIDDRLIEKNRQH